ncbi:MAG: cytochrome C554 [Acidobacteria bacterium]|nr:MAG: cytochrome C554 [Acidobacteriota bacterium]
MTGIRKGFAAVAALAFLAGGMALAAEHEFVGTKTCKKCHIKQWKSWSQTRMAKAFDILKPGERAEAKKAAGLDPQKDYTTDPNCLKCHTTGYGKPGGFKDIASTPDRAGVGCEMCHGAGKDYTKPDVMSLKNKNFKHADAVAAGMVDKVSEKQCLACHNEESPFHGGKYAFNFEERKDKGTHEHYPLKYQH